MSYHNRNFLMNNKSDKQCFGIVSNKPLTQAILQQQQKLLRQHQQFQQPPPVVANNCAVSPPTNGSTKGLLNAPGQNNCFLNCAVQVS